MKKILFFMSVFLNSILFGATQWCETHFKKIEKNFNIPNNLLHAIALTESGKMVPEKGMIAWPWTINVAGRGYIFQTKEKAILAAKLLQKEGIKSFDVGCMQINLMHHADAFQSLEQAFDPQNNITYAANFLSSLHKKHKDWHKASGDYHNIKPHFSTPYKKKVYHFMEKLHKHIDFSYLPEIKEINDVHDAFEDHFSEVNDLLPHTKDTKIHSTHHKILKNETEHKPEVQQTILHHLHGNHSFRNLNHLHHTTSHEKENHHHNQHNHHVHHSHGHHSVNTMVVKHSKYSVGRQPIHHAKKTGHVHIAK